MFHLDSFHPIPNTYRSEARRRRSFNQIDGIKQSFKPSRPGFFSPAAEGHVAAVDRQGIEIVKFKLVGTLSSASAYNQRRHSDQFGDVSEFIPVVQQVHILPSIIVACRVIINSVVFLLFVYSRKFR